MLRILKNAERDKWHPLENPRIWEGGWWLHHEDGLAYPAEVVVGMNDDGPCVIIWADLPQLVGESIHPFKQFIRQFGNGLEVEAQILAAVVGRLAICNAITLSALGFECLV